MHAGKTVFSQIMALLPMKQFHRCVERYQGHHKVKSFSCLDHFLCLAFAQLTYRESLRDIESCLRAVQPRLYHLGFRCPQVSRNTLAHANERRDWRIYADFAQVLIAEARALYAGEDFGLALDQTVYALDATVIDLSLSLFPWAPHQRSKAAVKVHTLLDLRGSIPSFLHISGAPTSDVSVLDHLPLQAGAFYIMDRGYIHFKRLYALAQAATFFVVRARANMQFRRRYSHPVDKTTGLRSDQTIVFTGVDSRHDYPAPARRVHFFDAQHHQDLVFLTNHFALPGADHRTALQEPLASGTVLQMDQAASAHQGLLRHLAQCRQGPNLDRRFCLPVAGHSQEATRTARRSLQNSTGGQCHRF